MNDIVYNKHRDEVTSKPLLWSAVQNITNTSSFTNENDVIRSTLPIL